MITPNDEVLPSLSFEQLKIGSGQLLVIDQFMLSNESFVAATRAALREQDAMRLELEVRKYGGDIINVSPGEYRVYRDPIELLLLVCEAKIECNDHIVFQIAEEKMQRRVTALSHVFVDTRCLVFVDAEFVGNAEVIDHYSQLRAKGEDKPARDYIRAAGGAVRYGFNRLGDELGVFEVQLKAGKLYCLWPDVA